MTDKLIGVGLVSAFTGFLDALSVLFSLDMTAWRILETGNDSRLQIVRVA